VLDFYIVQTSFCMMGNRAVASVVKWGMNLKTSMLLVTSLRMPGAISILRHASH